MLRRSEVTALGALLAVVLLATPAAGARQRIVVLKSDSLEPYARFSAAFAADVRADVGEQDCRGDKDRCDSLAQKISERPPDLIIALGPLAATQAVRLTDVKVLFAVVPAHEKYGLSGRNVAGIALTRPYKAQLEALRAAAPSIKRIGVLYDPRRSEATVDQVAGAAGELGLKLVKAKVEAAGVKKAARSLAGKADAVFLIPDPTLGSDTAFDEILRVCTEEKLPTFALTQSMVQEGMLVALSPDYAALGAQAARIANRVLDGTSPSTIGVAPPEGLDVSVNLATSRRLGLGDEAAASILRYAARLGYAVKAYESEPR